MIGGTVSADRWELMRALGAIADSPAASRYASSALGLAPASDAEHTGVFVLELPPFASIYLGPDGALGGEGTDRVAGFWRVLGIDPPAEPDHLSALLGLYASLGEGVTSARRPATVAALSRAQGSLFWEHIQSWLPAYLDAVSDLPGRGLSAWAELLQRVITAESARQQPCPALPLALRQAPAVAALAKGPREMADTLSVPVRSGMILTRCRLAAGASQSGVGHRVGERRFTLRAMLEQDPAATLTWLAAEASHWEHRHECHGAGEAARWWAGRARLTARTLRAGAVLAAGARHALPQLTWAYAAVVGARPYSAGTARFHRRVGQPRAGRGAARHVAAGREPAHDAAGTHPRRATAAALANGHDSHPGRGPGRGAGTARAQ